MIDIPTTTITVTQPNLVGTYDANGRYVEGEKTIINNVIASVQPLKPSEIQMLPEGRRNVEAIKVYTELKMFVSDEFNKKNASLILYDGKNYEVHMVSNWNIGTDIPYFKVIGIKIDGEGGGVNA